MTNRQRALMLAVARKAPAWYRAGDSGQGSSGGERVTLASLHRAGLVKRRVHRAGKSKADNAHEYALTDELADKLGRPRAIDDQPAPPAQETR